MTMMMLTRSEVIDIVAFAGHLLLTMYRLYVSVAVQAFISSASVIGVIPTIKLGLRAFFSDTITRIFHATYSTWFQCTRREKQAKD